MPVNVRLARGALRTKALIDAVLRGLSKSVVLSTLANPTPDFVKLEASTFKNVQFWIDHSKYSNYSHKPDFNHNILTRIIRLVYNI